MQVNRKLSGVIESAGADLQLWSGRLFMWPGSALYVGPAADTAAHAHHAVQISIGLDHAFALRGESTERWRRYDLALIEPDRTHQLDGGGEVQALLYLDPESTDTGRLLRGRSRPSFSLAPRELPADLVRRLGTCAEAHCTLGQAAAVTEELLSTLDPAAPTERATLDGRIAEIIATLRRAPERRLSAAAAAKMIHLSSHRFQHLFRDSTGIPFRRYQLWLGLLAAVETVAGGASLTEAAHAAGFSDSAHLSRTFRRTFGLTPSSIAKNSEFVHE